MKYECPLCLIDPLNHSLSFVLEKEDVLYYYTCASKAKLYFDTVSIINHYDGVLSEIPENKQWIWIFDGTDFNFKHSMIAAIDGVVIIRGVDFKAMSEKYQTPHPPEEESHKHLLDALDRYAESQNETLVIYSDEAPQQKRLGELFLEYKVTSTGGSYPRYLRNILRVEYIDSRTHVGIQIADLIVYLYRRMEDHFKENEYEKSRVRKLWQIIEPCIHPWYEPRIWP